MSRSLSKTATATAAVIAAGVIAWAVGSSTSSTPAPSPTAARGQPGQAPQPAQSQNGHAPPGFGQGVSGTTPDKVAKAASAKYPGTVERVMKLDDGSYVAHVITHSGEVHVAVSKDFKVLGVDQGGPPAGATPPQDGSETAPDGTTI